MLASSDGPKLALVIGVAYFYRATLCSRRVCCRRVSVCLSRLNFSQTTPHDSPLCQIFRHCSNGSHQMGDASCRWGRGTFKWAQIRVNFGASMISRERLKRTRQMLCTCPPYLVVLGWNLPPSGRGRGHVTSWNFGNISDNFSEIV